MMKYIVRITQTLEGWVEIEANSEKEALDIASEKYGTNGEELPDMETTRELQFDIQDDA
jgi:hypothetical protein